MNKNFSDSEIFKAFKEGNQHAYKLIFHELYKDLVVFSFSIVRDQMEAEDIVIETFQKMTPNAAGKNTYEHFRAALYTAIRNRSYNYYNRRMNRVVSIDETPISEPSEDSVSGWMLHGEFMKTIAEETDRLETEDQVLTEYLVFQGLPPKEVAPLLGMKVQTVRNRKSYILKRFKDALKRKGLLIFIVFNLFCMENAFMQKNFLKKTDIFRVKLHSNCVVLITILYSNHYH